MSTKTPSLQTRSQYNRDWGNFATLADVPNGSGNALANPYFSQLEVGDTAYVTESNTGFRCTSVGTSGGADAVWFAPVPEAQGFVVGNSVNGDTLANCNVLDTGSGAVLATALGVSYRTVIVRPGTYTVSSPISIGAGVAVLGSDSITGFTRFENTATSRQVISGANGVTIKNINFLSVAAGVGSAGTSMISCYATNTVIDNCVFFSSPTTVNDTMSSFINVLALGTTKITVRDCTFSGPSTSVYHTTAGAIELSCVSMVDDVNLDLRRITNNKMSQCDVGIIFNGRSIITGNSITAYRTAIVDRSASGTDSTGSIIANNTLTLSASGTTTPVAGVEFTGIGGTGVIVDGNYFRNTTGGATGIAINIAPAAVMYNTLISNNIINFWDSGIVLSANTQDGLVRDNIIQNTTPTITNSGTGNFTTIQTAEITDLAVTPPKLAARPAGKMDRVGGPAIANNTLTTIAFNNSVFTVGGVLAPTLNTGTGVITINYAGVYRVTANVMFNASVAFPMDLIIQTNTGTKFGPQSVPTTGITVSDMYQFSVADTLYIEVKQQSGGPLNFASNQNVTFSVEWVGH